MMYNYGLIGNCTGSALVSELGAVDWFCAPRPDSPPVFGRMLDDSGGHFAIEGIENAQGRQYYKPNTNILVTEIRTEEGAFRITDFFPRFEQMGRMYRPMALFRIVEKIAGSPTIRVSCRPVSGWDKSYIRPQRGNSHLRYELRGEDLRLTTNMALTYLLEETPFVLNEPLFFALTSGLGLEGDLREVSHQFLERTEHYWKTWVKHCSIPSLYQKETIRSALALKLHVYEDTGAILAALTTSLPEEIGEVRNWDYRFCWLRDAHFVLTAFHNLGHFEEMEGFIKFLLNIALKHEHSRDRLHPVYALDQSLPLPEREHRNWAGYGKSSPVRENNQAAEHVQNDVYGEMVLTLVPIFLDERFHHLRTKEHEELLGHLGRFCVRSISEKDAGLWEVRNGWQEHSFSNLMCWAGIDRLQKMQSLGFLRDLSFDLESARARAEQALQSAIVSGSLRNGPKDDTFDAALLLAPVLRYPDRDVSRQTVLAIADALKFEDFEGFLYRYLRNDDFGKPRSAFMICSFWLVQALARTGELERAKAVMASVMRAANGVGLFAEHYLPGGHQQFGNFPQAYSHVGQINAAFAISPNWDQVL